MTNFYPFPVGRFTQSEWKAGCSLYMNESEAAAEAELRAALAGSTASRTSISEVDLAYLSLVSRELEERVNQYRRECLPESLHLDDVGISEEREKDWVELKDYLRRGLNGK